ncbi:MULTISPECIES: hypothetical protein [Pantoea]|jgi:hypothetical protein|uniref:hypothetical protein n=1 Tax=Pantoea TaxID=53335 RepID=UPI000FE1423C|nr:MULTISPECIES: hypothetical protein [Pantoea]KAA6051157.1 hypothetical protein F3I35_03975 [Pantoea sp. Bo_7]KAA6095510.1 hypothetical protein F3I22_03980 [Pantoea sp. Bo_10]
MDDDIGMDYLLVQHGGNTRGAGTLSRQIQSITGRHNSIFSACWLSRSGWLIQLIRTLASNYYAFTLPVNAVEYGALSGKPAA